MTIEDSALFSEAFRERIREEKKKSGLTIDQVVENAGVSKTAVIKLLSSGKVELKLNDCIALCRFFGLSIDEMYGLRAPAPAAEIPRKLLDRNRDLEIENARLRASNEALRAQICSVHSIAYILLFISALLAMSLIAYLVIDAQIKKRRTHSGRLAVRARVGLYRPDCSGSDLWRHRDRPHYPARKQGFYFVQQPLNCKRGGRGLLVFVLFALGGLAALSPFYFLHNRIVHSRVDDRKRVHQLVHDRPNGGRFLSLYGS